MSISRILLYLSLIIFTRFSFAQKCGIITDSNTKKGIPYVTLSIPSKSIGTISEDNGKFCFDVKDIRDSILISALGYESIKISFDYFKNTDLFSLKEKNILLNEVIVKSKKVKNIILGAFTKSTFFSGSAFNPNSNYIIASKVHNSNNIDGFITKLHYRMRPIKSDFIKKFRLRCRVFKNGENDKPSDDLLIENTIIDIDTGEKKIEVDISSQNIYLKDEFVWVAVETIGYIDKEYKYVSLSDRRFGEVIYKKNIPTKAMKILSLSPSYLMTGEGKGLMMTWTQRWDFISTSKNSVPLFGLTLTY